MFLVSVFGVHGKAGSGHDALGEWMEGCVKKVRLTAVGVHQHHDLGSVLDEIADHFPDGGDVFGVVFEARRGAAGGVGDDYGGEAQGLQGVG